MARIDVSSAPAGSGSRYPSPFDVPCRGRSWRRLGEAAGLTQLGVNLVHLAPGAWSSQRHWHSHEDEFVYVPSGENADHGENSDIDMVFTAGRYSGGGAYRHKDGTPY